MLQYASLRWLNNVTDVYLVQVSLLFTGQKGLGHFIRHRPWLPIGWRIVQILRQRRRKMTNTGTTPTTLLKCVLWWRTTSFGGRKYLQSELQVLGEVVDTRLQAGLDIPATVLAQPLRWSPIYFYLQRSRSRRQNAKHAYTWMTVLTQPLVRIRIWIRTEFVLLRICIGNADPDTGPGARKQIILTFNLSNGNCTQIGIFLWQITYIKKIFMSKSTGHWRRHPPNIHYSD